MQVSLAYPVRARTQAIPMAEYRRRQLLSQLLPRFTVLAVALLIFPVTTSPWFPGGGLRQSAGTRSMVEPGRNAMPTSIVVSEPANLAAATIDQQRVGVAAGELAKGLDGPAFALASGGASITGIGYAATENVKIAIGFIDGTVIEPGGRFSFDDTARTWDYEEDPAYLWDKATSAWGPIDMRGGGVCWLATAVWRAAMWSGLATEVRENHYGLVGSLGGGFDATNTLVIRNNSDVPVTIRAWIEGEYVYASVMSSQPLDRTATIRGPVRLGTGRYAVYQDVQWDDGDFTTREFTSRYMY
jgi:hypothetical protein